MKIGKLKSRIGHFQSGIAGQIRRPAFGSAPFPNARLAISNSRFQDSQVIFMGGFR